MPEIELKGLDGGNLLAFLAAMGTFRVLSIVAGEAEVRMRWQRKAGWMPVIECAAIPGEDELLDLLERRVCGEKTVDESWNIGKDLTLTKDEFAAKLHEFLETTTTIQWTSIDFLAAFGSEAFGKGPKGEQMSDTKLRAIGGGQQRFLGFMRELADLCAREHLKRSLFEDWDYADPRPSMRWDPLDYRPHALRAKDPSGDPIKTMRGANRLAIEAVPLFPTVPCNRWVGTVGFDENVISWPIWRDSLEIESVKSLLACVEIQKTEPSRYDASRRGLLQILRARRFTDDKYKNFGPAREMF